MGATIASMDYRGRLRQRVPVWQPANCLAPGTRWQFSRYLHRHLQQRDVSIAATGILGHSGWPDRTLRSDAASDGHILDAHHAGCDVRFYAGRPLWSTRAENAADLR